MRFEAGALPSPELLAAIGKLTEEKIINAAFCASGISRSLVSVRIVSGAMQFTRTLYGPTWAATSWVSSSIVAFAAA